MGHQVKSEREQPQPLLKIFASVSKDGGKEFKNNFRQPQSISTSKPEDNINQKVTLPVPKDLSNKEKVINHRGIKNNFKLFRQVKYNSDSLKNELIPGESSTSNDLNRHKLRKVTKNDAEFNVKDSNEHIMKEVSCNKIHKKPDSMNNLTNGTNNLNPLNSTLYQSTRRIRILGTYQKFKTTERLSFDCSRPFNIISLGAPIIVASECNPDDAAKLKSSSNVLCHRKKNDNSSVIIQRKKTEQKDVFPNQLLDGKAVDLHQRNGIQYLPLKEEGEPTVLVNTAKKHIL
ncbi:hypothetical protein TNIN_98581 [Trichonephila inaurata madagascariensis]|uniref:Uncharacterized protein n=1 Tax=Trichonephila inaurata madagascariensis TaxID=2747483 RepID=A0A8X6Y458_9ARAC|nr:hypothetical protein TNIN_98581 [Trichonephila inaurata madagascariensis]